ncbi:hypothetical protein WNY59_11675 [Ahrensia kielensis]|uniref:D-glucuronyl C5-epimerase C-terminal domain-containing protein n=1 Tax=Ahrensia kielensis TaxID=76980 RepID=A0ABU9T7Z4_9HYPH
MTKYLFAVIFFILLECATVASSPCQIITGGDNCITPYPFQPSVEDLGTTATIHDTGEAGFDFEMYGNGQKTILVGGVPFSRYWQLKDPTKFVFHPMVFGRYVFNSADDLAFQQNVNYITNKIGISLPNDGLAFYYPNHYPLNRMRGPDIVYSAISQSEALAGYLRIDTLVNSRMSRNLLKRVKDALFFPHSEGGVDLNVAQLEIPLYRSNPEIILNGWLHSLLHLNDYAVIMNDMKVAKYIEQNLEFFADNHKVWYDSERFISRYSDTSPHRILLSPSKKGQELSLVYRARDNRLQNYLIKPVIDLTNDYSGFDVRISDINRFNGNLTMTVTCTGLFDTFIVSTDPFSFKIRDGGYSPHRATPDGSGDWITIKSLPRGDQDVAEISLKDSELICGYPTNFSKANTKNYYHTQHIVALLYLAETTIYENQVLNSRLKKIALEWLENNNSFNGEGLEFETPKKVLAGINRGKALNQITDISELIPPDLRP